MRANISCFAHNKIWIAQDLLIAVIRIMWDLNQMFICGSTNARRVYLWWLASQRFRSHNHWVETTVMASDSGMWTFLLGGQSCSISSTLQVWEVYLLVDRRHHARSVGYAHRGLSSGWNMQAIAFLLEVIHLTLTSFWQLLGVGWMLQI